MSQRSPISTSTGSSRGGAAGRLFIVVGVVAGLASAYIMLGGDSPSASDQTGPGPNQPTGTASDSLGGSNQPRSQPTPPQDGAPPVVRIPWATPRQDTVDADELDAAIQTSTQYLIRNCDQQGRFVYELDLDTGQSATTRYNVLRHAGAMYSLAVAYKRSRDPEALAALQRAARFLRRECVQQLPEHDDISAVWSDPQLTQSTSPRVAKLGGTGLGLAALASLEQIAPGSVPQDELTRLGRFLTFMQKEDGGFYSRYFVEQGRDDSWTSLYYPGEACLGALMLYELDHQPEWREVARRGLGYLARPAAFQQPPLPDHWMLIALGELESQLDFQVDVDFRERLLRHAERTSLGIQREQKPRRGDPLLDGSFGLDGRTAPAATRLEGLLAARRYLGDRAFWHEAKLDAAIIAGVRFLLRCHVLQGPQSGAVPMAQGPLPGNDDRSRQFNARVRWVRIDYVQHSLCALVEFERQFDEPASPPHE